MINTYQTSLPPPPPVPPRLGRSRPVLNPGLLPSRGHSRHFVGLLLGVVVVHLFLSVAAFLYLYHKHQSGDQVSSGGGGWGSAAAQTSEKRKASVPASAHMVNMKRGDSRPKTSAGRLQWDMSHSALKHINYYQTSWLTVLQPGQYYVYSSVTFSRGDPSQPLVSQVKVRDDKNAGEQVAMQAFCYLRGGEVSAPIMCTATQGRLMALQAGNQLSVWVSNLSLVDYADAGTTFGMYKV